MASPYRRVILKLSGEALGLDGKLFCHEKFEQTARMLKTLYVGIRLSHDVRVNVYKQHTECDRYKKQRLKFMLNRKIQEEASHCDHNVIAPVQIKKRRLVKQVV